MSMTRETVERRSQWRNGRGLLIIAVLVALGSALLLQQLRPTGSFPVVEELGAISISVLEPLINNAKAARLIEASVFITSKDEGRAFETYPPFEYFIDTEEEFEVVTLILNSGSEDLVIELVPTIRGDFQKAPEWEIRPYASEAQYQFLENIQGPAHLLVKKGGGYYITVAFVFPKDAEVSFVSVYLNIHGTDCSDVEICPWG